MHQRYLDTVAGAEHAQTPPLPPPPLHLGVFAGNFNPFPNSSSAVFLGCFFILIFLIIFPFDCVYVSAGVNMTCVWTVARPDRRQVLDLVYTLECNHQPAWVPVFRDDIFISNTCSPLVACSQVSLTGKKTKNTRSQEMSLFDTGKLIRFFQPLHHNISPNPSEPFTFLSYVPPV